MSADAPKPDIVAERAVLGGLFQYGSEAFFDIVDVLQPEAFTDDTNKAIYKCAKSIYEQDHDAKLDYALIISRANDMGYGDLFKRTEVAQHLRAISTTRGELRNVRRHAAKLKKIDIALTLTRKLDEARSNLMSVTGNETMEQILSMVEGPIFEHTTSLNESNDSSMNLLAEGIDDYIQNIMDNPVENVGISTGYPLYDESIGGGLRPPELDIIGARMKVGKALDNDSLVYTNFGPQRIGDMQVGTKVCIPDGNLSYITGVYPQGKKKAYKVSFSDGTSVICCDEHLWNVKSYRSKIFSTMPLKNILNESLRTKGKAQQHRFSIPQSEACYYSKFEYGFLDAYLLGLLLGDGSFRNTVQITSADVEIPLAISKLLPEGYEIHKIESHKYDYYISRDKKLVNELKRLELWNKLSTEKHIPKEYLYSPVSYRWDLLQGLMDTDGYVSKNGICLYYTSSIELAQNICELVTSLGGIAVFKNKPVWYKKKHVMSYSVRISFNDNRKCFRLERKKSRCSARVKKPICRKIDKIEYVGEREMTCIKIADPKGLFLTNNHIVTHNTQLADNIAFFVAENYNIPVMNLDTEMSREQHWNRIIANLSDVPVNEIQTGKFTKQTKEEYGTPAEKIRRVLEAKERFKKAPYYYDCIANRPFEETLAALRRWLMKHVGFDETGKAKPCLIVYDYIKLLSAEGLGSSMQEFQALGFLVTALKNFQIRYHIPVLAFCQLNRDAIDKETTDIVMGSDRILMYCSSFSIYKTKSREEVAEDGTKNGNRKLIPKISRNGPAMEDGNYICMQFDGDYARVKQLTTKDNIELEKDNAKSFEVEHDNDEGGEIPFGE